MGRSFKPINYFSPNDSKTVCDVTGFVVKRSQVMRRWEGFMVIAEAFHPRQPQDTPVIPVAQKTYADVRTQSEDDTAAAAITPI